MSLVVVVLAALACGALVVALTSTSRTKHTLRATRPAGPRPPLAVLSATAVAQLTSADEVIITAAGAARSRKLTMLLARYHRAGSAQRGEILKEIAHRDPSVVTHGNFGEPTGINAHSVSVQNAGGVTSPSSQTLAESVTHVEQALAGANFATLITKGTARSGEIGGPESAPQSLDFDIKELKEAGSTVEAKRLTSFEEHLAPATPNAEASYRHLIASEVRAVNTAASHARESTESSANRDEPILTAKRELELTPPPSFTADRAKTAVTALLETFAVTVATIGVIPQNERKLIAEADVVDARFAHLLEAVGASAQEAHILAQADHPTRRASVPTTTEAAPQPTQPPATSEPRTQTLQEAREEAERARERAVHKLEAEEERNGKQACEEAEAQRHREAERGESTPSASEETCIGKYK